MTPPPITSQTNVNQPHQYQYSYIYSPINVQSQPPPPPSNCNWTNQYQPAQFVANWPSPYSSYYSNFPQHIPPPPGQPAYGTTFDTKKSNESIPIYSDDSIPPPPPPPIEDGRVSTPRGAALSDDMIAMPHDDSSKYVDHESFNAQEGNYSDEEQTKQISVDACIKAETMNIDPLISQSLTYLDTENDIKSLTINKSAKRIQSELSLTNTASIDTNNSLFSDSETSMFSKSKSIIFLNENDEEDGHQDTKKEDDDATIREYEEYIKKHNKKRRKKEKMIKKKRSKEKLLSPKTKTVFKKTTLRRSSTHKKNDPEYRKAQREKKEAMNLSRMGFKLKTKNRYRIDDGRIGICKFRGRTAFGKPHEDWIGLMIEHGDGAHNGTVDGVTYFRCAQGKGIMVRPLRIIEDMGLPNGYELTPKMIRGSKSIRKLLEDIAFKKEQDLIYGD